MWKFNPILKTTIWGGDRIIPYKGLDSSLTGIGESWEISGVAGNETTVSSGPDKGLTTNGLLHKYGSALLGERNYRRFGDRFPLLIKFIDARQDLSVQVHPDDEMAHRLGFGSGKTEMWYVIKSDKGARLANGFSRPVDPAEFDSLVESGRIEDVLNYNDIRPGDVFFIPAGRVHAICAGAFVAEIQQTSDLTYRIYDYHRKDSEGRERELHVDLAREATDFGDTDGRRVEYRAVADVPVNVVRSPFFSTNVLSIDTELLRDYSESDTFVVIIITEGEADITCGDEKMHVRQGETILVPACANGIIIEPAGKTTMLETFIN